MKCPVCRNGETQRGMVTVTLERDGATLVFKSIPAEVCENGGKEYVSDETTRHLLRQAEQAMTAGVQLEVRRFAAA